MDLVHVRPTSPELTVPLVLLTTMALIAFNVLPAKTEEHAQMEYQEMELVHAHPFILDLFALHPKAV